VADEHALCVREGVDDDGSGVPQADLEDRVPELPPPLFADCCVVGAEGEEVTGDRQSAGDFRDPFYEWDISERRELL